MADVVQQTCQTIELVLNIADLLTGVVDQGVQDSASNIVDSNRMGKARIVSSREHEMCQPQLLDIPQTLEGLR